MNRAQEIYYESLVNKQNRDARNPIMESAVAGWTAGIDRGMKSKQENDDNLKKGMLKSALDRKDAREKLAAKIIDENYILVDGKRDNSATAVNAAVQALIDGVDSIKGVGTISFEPKKTVESGYDKERGKLKAQKEFGTFKDPKETGYTEKDWQERVLAIKDALIGLGERTKENATAYDKYANEYQLATQNLIKARGQQPPAVAPTMVAPVQTAPITPAQPTLPVEKVKEIGNAALKVHYAHTAVNPKTGAKIYSDDGITWYDEKGNQIQ